MTDFLRFWWSLIYWNTRKTLFWMQGRQGRAPCQHPSDSGKGMETGCEACLTWSKPSRFNRVCPLVVKSDCGWRCSVDAAKVRPFWGRAIGCWVLALASSYVLLALVLLLTFRSVGYESLRFVDFFTPGVKARFREAQSGYFANRAERSFANGDFRDGLLSLSIAYSKNPRDWATGLTLARLLQRSSQYKLGDDVFERLLGEFPERTEEISAIWSEALLFRGDWARLAAMCAERVAAGGPSKGAWMRTFVFSLRRFPKEQLAARAAGFRGDMGKSYDWILDAEIALRAGDLAEARTMVEGISPGSDAFIAQYSVEVAIDSGNLQAASILLSANQSVLGGFFHNLLGARIAVDMNQESVASLSFGNLLTHPVTMEKLDFACAELLRRPSKERFRTALDAFIASPEARRRPDYIMAFVAAAAACGDDAGLERLYEASVALDGTTIARLRVLADAIAGKSSEVSNESILTGYPFPRESMLALIEWLERTDRR